MADTDQPELSLDRFRALVEAYGSDVERFPRSERNAARELLARSASAQRLVQAAHAFDQVLADARSEATPVPSRELLERLSAIPQQHAQRGVVHMLPFRSSAQSWLLAAAAVLLGVLGGGYLNGEGELADPRVDRAQVEFASLTFADELFEDLATQPEGDPQ